MNEATEPQFVDTNVLIYAYDSDAGAKHIIAKQLMAWLWKNKIGHISTQVLQEFYVNVTRKTKQPLSVDQAKRAIQTLSYWTVFSPRPADFLAAIDLSVRYQISFWDALVIRSAQKTDCKLIWSEDLAHGQEYDGVIVRNPFVA